MIARGGATIDTWGMATSSTTIDMDYWEPSCVSGMVISIDSRREVGWQERLRLEMKLARYEAVGESRRMARDDRWVERRPKVPRTPPPRRLARRVFGAPTSKLTGRKTVSKSQRRRGRSQMRRWRTRMTDKLLECPLCGGTVTAATDGLTCENCKSKGRPIAFPIKASPTMFVSGQQVLASAVVYLILKTRDRTSYESQDERVEEAELLRRAAKMAGRGDDAYESPFELCHSLLNLFEGPRG